jgi:hypothetical protein
VQDDPLAAWIADVGPVVGGGAAVGGALGFLAGALVHDLGRATTDPLRWGQQGGYLGGAGSLLFLFLNSLG